MKSISLEQGSLQRRDFLRNKYLWITLGVVLLVVIGSYFAYNYFSAESAEVSEAPQLQTAVARMGDLTVFATGAGQMIPAKEVNLGFDEAGTLEELLVKIGDLVQEGDVIARLETNQSEDEIALALAEAELNVLTAQQELDDVSSPEIRLQKILDPVPIVRGRDIGY